MEYLISYLHQICILPSKDLLHRLPNRRSHMFDRKDQQTHAEKSGIDYTPKK